MRGVEWSSRAEAAWKALSPSDAELIAKAAVRFAEQGEGDIDIGPRADGGLSVRLYVGSFVLLIGLPPAEESMTAEVLGFYKLA